MAVAEWETVVLADVARLDIDGVSLWDDEEYQMAGLVIAGQGLFWRDSVRGSATAYDTFHRLHTGQLVMRKLTAWEGPITTVPPEFDGAFVSPEFPTFTLETARLLPEYMRLICQLPGFHREMKMRSTGTAERRKRLNPDGLLAITIGLPPISTQRDIIETIGAIDRVIAAYSAEAESAAALLRTARVELLGSRELRPLGDFISDIQGGKSTKALDRPPSNGERGVLKVSAIRPGEFRPEEAKALVGKFDFPQHACVREGDLLISRANTRALVGATCRVEDDFPLLYLSDKTLRLVLDDELVDSRYLVQAIRSRPAREFIEANATGTSDSMKNISHKTILATPIPYVDDVAEQRSISRRLDAIWASGTYAERLAVNTRAMRASLLDALTERQLRVVGGIDPLREVMAV